MRPRAFYKNIFILVYIEVHVRFVAAQILWVHHL